MKTGVFTVSMPEYTPEEAVRVLKELGYDGVEWRVAPITEANPDAPFEDRYWKNNKCTLDLNRIEKIAEDVKRMTAEQGLEILSLTSYLRPHEYEKIESVLKAAVIMETPQIRIFTPDYKGTEDFVALFNQTRKDMKVLEGLARKYGIKIVFEIHMDNIVASASAACRMLEGLDPKYIGVIYDPGNMVNEGFENYRKGFEMLGDYIAHVHVKNGKLEPCGEDENGALIWKRTWTPIKKGSADLKQLFAVMKEKGYDGAVSIEDFSNEDSTYDKLKSIREYLKILMA